jgi:hypothetical protein
VLEQLADSLPQEREAVGQRLESLRRGDKGGVDIHPCTSCGLGIAAMLVCGVTGLWFFAGGLAIGSGAVCGEHHCLW